jgi:hypothetical protein
VEGAIDSLEGSFATARFGNRWFIDPEALIYVLKNKNKTNK